MLHILQDDQQVSVRVHQIQWCVWASEATQLSNDDVLSKDTCYFVCPWEYSLKPSFGRLKEEKPFVKMEDAMVILDT